MTQEENLREAKRLYETANADQKYVLETLFPELKESEDEKIRKRLISYFKSQLEARKNDSPEVLCTYNKWIAWLEKQQKPVGFNVGDEITVNGQVCRVVAVDNPAWSEEDEAVLDALIKRLEGEDINVSPHLAVKCLKSLKDRVLPQPKQEWNANDERILYNIHSYITYAKDSKYHTPELMVEAKDWLDSLKYRVQPQNTWKPSGEQIEALDFAADCIVPAEFCVKRKELKGLLEQLKKLREE